MKKEELHKQLKELELKKRMKILVHVSLSKIGYVDNGPDSLILKNFIYNT